MKKNAGKKFLKWFHTFAHMLDSEPKGNRSSRSISKKTLVYDCMVKGSFAASIKMPSRKRSDIVTNIPVGSDLFLETAYFEGTPYFLVCVSGGLDIGALPAELSQMIKSDCPDAHLAAKLTDKTDPEHPQMRLTIYRSR